MEGHPPAGLENMADAECAGLLRSHDLGRVALVDPQGRPLIFPVNYFFDEGIVLFRTAPGTKLDLAPGSYAAFEIDGWDRAHGSGWSVVVKGIAHELADPPTESRERLRSWPVHPAAPGPHEHWIGIWANEITGRRFRQEAGPPG